MRFSRLVALAWLLLSAFSSAASELVPVGPPFSLLDDSPAAEVLRRSAVSATPVEGGFAAVWHEIGNDLDRIGMIRLGAFGEKGGVFPIYDWYPRSLGLPSCPTLASLGPDRVVVAWNVNERPAGWSIIAFRRFEAHGDAVDGTVRVVRAPLGVVLSLGCPVAVGNENGRFALAWSSASEPTHAQAQAFGPTGERATPILELATASPWTGPPAVGLDRSGRLLFAADDLRGAIWGERFSPSGAPLGDIFRIGRGGGDVAIGAVPSGGFAVAWSRGETGGRRIFLRRYGADGRPLGRPKDIGTTKRFNHPIVRMDRSGRAVLFWIGEDEHPLGRLLESDLSPAGALIDLGPIAENSGIGVSLAILGHRVLVAWVTPPADVGATVPLFGQLFEIRP